MDGRRDKNPPYKSEPIHPQSMETLRQLVKLHGANRLHAALDDIVREMREMFTRKQKTS
jgi:hypothetical protein